MFSRCRVCAILLVLTLPTVWASRAQSVSGQSQSGSSERPRQSDELPDLVLKGNEKIVGQEPPIDSTVLPDIVDPIGGRKAIPLELSSVIAIATVTSRTATIIHDEPRVLFQATIDRVLKSSEPSSIKSIEFSRYGGRLHFPSGRVQEYRIYGQRMPQVGVRYVLFLSGSMRTDFTLETAYLLSGSKAYALDQSSVYREYDDVPERKLLDAIPAK